MGWRVLEGGKRGLVWHPATKAVVSLFVLLPLRRKARLHRTIRLRTAPNRFQVGLRMEEKREKLEPEAAGYKVIR